MVKVFSEEALKIFCEYHWPGNFRELENVIETLVNVYEKDLISSEHIPSEIIKSTILRRDGKIKIPGFLEKVMQEAEKEAVLKALSYSKNNKVKAAQLLGIHRSHLYYIMKKHNLRRRDV